MQGQVPMSSRQSYRKQVPVELGPSLQGFLLALPGGPRCPSGNTQHTRSSEGEPNPEETPRSELGSDQPLGLAAKPASIPPDTVPNDHTRPRGYRQELPRGEHSPGANIPPAGCSHCLGREGGQEGQPTPSSLLPHCPARHRFPNFYFKPQNPCFSFLH